MNQNKFQTRKLYIFNYLIQRDVDKNQAKFIERLREAVAIMSISGEPQRRKDVVQMVSWAKKVKILDNNSGAINFALIFLNIPIIHSLRGGRHYQKV